MARESRPGIAVAQDATRCAPFRDGDVRFLRRVDPQRRQRANVDDAGIVAQVFVECRAAFDSLGRTLGSEVKFGDDTLIAHIGPALHVFREKGIDTLAQKFRGGWLVAHDCFHILR